MAETYDYGYLIVEGIWRPGEEGQLQTGWGTLDTGPTFGGRWGYQRGGAVLHYRAVDNYLSTLELHAGIIYRRTLSATETVFTIVDLYRWWNEKQWAEHSSHLAVYAPAEPRATGRRLHLAKREVSLAEKWAMQLPGIDAKAQQVAAHFGSARALALATEAEWTAIKGIGKLTAKKITREIADASVPSTVD
jgi:ERCC4-type nuclease